MIAVAQGLSNAEIAASLHMSVATVKTHVSRILNKTDTRDRTQLVVLAYQSGLVSDHRESGCAGADEGVRRLRTLQCGVRRGPGPRVRSSRGARYAAREPRAGP